MLSITATIITKNEQDRIAGAIASVSWCDEVLVVDSESNDDTRRIAKQCGARVLTRPWDGYSRQKNFAAEQARHDWILSLDADERLSAEVSEEILAWKRNGTKPGAASMPRRVFYLGGWINHSGWYPDRKIRLYDRRFASWEGDLHESVRVNGSVRALTGDLLHFPYRSWNDHLQRIEKYSALAAQSAQASGRKDGYGRLVFGSLFAFIRAFFVRGGFLDGWRGAVIAYSAARYVFIRQLRILR